MKTTIHTFTSHGARCEADLYLPDASKPAVVVLAQGYAAERGFGTQGIIRALVDAGIAVFAFDYRGFGGSENIEGQPRQLVDPVRQLEDWQAALGYVSKLAEVDTQRIGIWGSSYAGGHVISVAGSEWSRALSLRAVVSQIPHCDSRNAFKLVGFKGAMQGGGHGLKASILSLFGITHTVPVVGKPDDPHFAVMKHKGWYEGYLGMTNNKRGWVNAVPATSLFRSANYNPIDYASNIQVPVLVVYGAKDQGIPPDDVERTANMIKQVELFRFDGDHFDVYDGGVHQAEAIKKQVEFLKRELA